MPPPNSSYTVTNFGQPLIVTIEDRETKDTKYGG